MTEYWKDISAKSLCISGKEIYFLNSTDVAQISVLKSGAKGAEKITLPQICNPVSLDILDEEIFLLTTDGIYIGNGSSQTASQKSLTAPDLLLIGNIYLTLERQGMRTITNFICRLQMKAEK